MSWNSLSFATDAELGMPRAGAEADLRTVAGDAPLANVVRTLRAAEDGRLARGFYTLGDRGCLLFFLHGIRSKEELLTHPFDEDTGLAARRLVRFWDYGRLELTEVVRVLKEHIAARQDANRLEDEAVLRARVARATA